MTMLGYGRSDAANGKVALVDETLAVLGAVMFSGRARDTLTR